MRILLTGANGYIGSRLLPVLAEEGHEIVALVRSARRLDIPQHLQGQVTVVVGDLLKRESLDSIPDNIDAAYYLVHSMGEQATGFSDDEAKCAQNFAERIDQTSCQQVIYLGGLAARDTVSEHMASRRRVETLLKASTIPVTVLRAGIIIGSGSASFEIIRDLVEKLPVMIAPRWVKSRCQPIAVSDVIFYLKSVLGNANTYSRSFDIGGPQILTYRQMLLDFAKARGLRRLIIPVPVLTPRLSSYWLFFITSTNFSLAQALVNSMKTDALCFEESIKDVIEHDCISYKEALRRAFVKIEQNAVVSSWKDALVRSQLTPDLTHYIEVPKHGCLKETIQLHYTEREAALNTLWSIGGDNGWYYMDWAWRLRGILDQLIGGIGLRRGRTHPTRLRNGDALDFWRVLLAEREKGHLLLYAEMRVPGDAWLEYKIESGTVTQTATFRPKGLWGRLYWYSLTPIHYFVFRGLCRAVAKGIHST